MANDAAGPPVQMAARGSLPRRYAGFRQRLAACLLDFVVVFGVYVAVTFAIYIFLGFFVLTGLFLDEETISLDTLVAIVSVLGALAAFFYILLGNSYGGTIGKRMLGLQVVSALDGSNIGPLRGLARYLVYVIGAIPLYLGWLWSIWDSQKQTWHDKAAGSIVVKKA